MDSDVIGSVERPWPASGRRRHPARPWSTSAWSSRSTTSTVLEKVLGSITGEIAGMIMEPLMMNAGIVPPEPGYLEGVRELTPSTACSWPSTR